MTWLWIVVTAIWGAPLVAAGILMTGSFISRPLGTWLHRHLIG